MVRSGKSAAMTRGANTVKLPVADSADPVGVRIPEMQEDTKMGPELKTTEERG